MCRIISILIAVYFSGCLSALSAMGDSLKLLNDLNPTQVRLIPFDSCAVGGRVLVAARGLDQPRAAFSVIDATDFPKRLSIIHRVGGASLESEVERPFAMGCFRIGSAWLWPSRWRLSVMAPSGAVRYLPYPQGFSGAIYAFMRGSALYVVGSSAEVIKINSRGGMSWVVSPYSEPLLTHVIISPSKIAFKGSSFWSELDLLSLRRQRQTIDLSFKSYYRAERGVIAVKQEQGVERSQIQIYLGDATHSGSVRWNRSAIIKQPPLFSNGRGYVIANSREVWSLDGNVDGARLIFKEPLFQEPQSEVSISLLAVMHERLLIVSANKLWSVASDGTSIILSSDLPDGDYTVSRNGLNESVILGEGVLIRSDGTGDRTTRIDDPRVEPTWKVFSLPNTLILGSVDDAFEVRGDNIEQIKLYDVEATTSSASEPMGQINSRLIIKLASKAGEILYLSDEDLTNFQAIYTGADPWGELKALGTVGERFLFTEITGDLLAYSLREHRIERLSGDVVRPVSAGSDYERLFPTSSSPVFVSGDGIWAVSPRGDQPTLLVSAPKAIIEVWSQLIWRGVFYFSSRSLSRMTGNEIIRWKSDGTMAGSRTVSAQDLKGIPRVDNQDGLFSVNVTTADGVERRLWSKLRRDRVECLAAPRMIVFADRLFIHDVCDGLFEINHDLGGVRLVMVGFIPWVIEGGDYLYIGRRLSSDFSGIYRIHRKTQLVELSVALNPDDYFSREARFQSKAISVGGRLITWLNSQRFGYEPFLLEEGEDRCPLNPSKRSEGVCGCQAIEADLDGNDLIDCLDPYTAPRISEFRLIAFLSG